MSAATHAKPSAARRVLAWLALLLVRLIHLTCRVRVVGRARSGCIYAFWHGDQVALSATELPQVPAVLVSRSRDGALASYVVQRLGYSVVRGSTSSGAAGAALALLRRLRARLSVAVAVDGPRGPRHRAGDGVARIAARAGAELVPAAAVARRGWSLRSWDRLQVPAPFSTVFVVLGAPVRDGDVESALARTHARARWLARRG